MLASMAFLHVSLDLSTFFGFIEWGLKKGLASELGLPPHILDTLLAFPDGAQEASQGG